MLATSRTPLNVSGEYQYIVSPLPEADAVGLFLERAVAVDAYLDRSAAVEEICRRLDRLPLAIELAAARAKTLPPEMLLARLEERLALLTRGPQDAPERQRTLRATIEWSFALLDPDEQRVFARFAVFGRGCTLDAAEEVCDATLETLEAIVANSLMSYDAGRFTMLETIHDYARERLEASGETERISRRLVERLITVAESFGAAAERGEVPSLVPLERELDNFRAGIRAALTWPGDPLALRLTAALLSFWTVSGRHAEGLRWAVAALDGTVDAPVHERADCLRAAAQLATIDADLERALAFGELALSHFRAEQDDVRVAEVLRWLASAYTQAGNGDAARELHAESIELNEHAASPLRLARALRVAGEDELELGDSPRAIELIRRALELATSGGHERDTVMVLHSLGDALLVNGDTDAARRSYLAALGRTDSIYVSNTAHCLGGLAAVAACDRRIEVAAALWNAVASYERDVGGRLIYPHALRRYTAAFESIDGAEFADAVRKSEELTLERAMLLAFERLGGPADEPFVDPQAGRGGSGAGP